MARITKLTINYEEHPVGIGEIEQIGWIITSEEKNVIQKSYQLQISLDNIFTNIVYDSGNVCSAESAHIRLTKSDFLSLTKYYIRVKIKTTNGDSTDWYQDSFITALSEKEEWSGDFISVETDEEIKTSQGSYIRKQFDVSKEVKEAYVSATALGLYHLYINGEKISRDEFAPGWTSYKKHLLYQTYEVTDYIKKENVIGALVGAGWYKGTMGFTRHRNLYGEKTAFFCRLLLRYTDGTEQIINTDTTWEGQISPILFSEIYDGEIYDARKEIDYWCETNCNYHNWRKAERISFSKNVLVPQSGSKVQMVNMLPVKQILCTQKGEIVLDFGQNLTGWVSFAVKGKEGDVVELRCFETLDAQGNVYLDNLRSAKQRIEYTCKGGQTEYYHPHFTYQGFQYVQIVRYPEDILSENFKACVVHSKMQNTGKFSSSNQLVNQLNHNILWGMKDNFLDIPMDCPQRDERVGWTGDAQIFCRTASFLMNTYTFYRKWLVDLAADQTEEGGVPHVIPDIISGRSDGDEMLEQGTHSAAAWADAAVIIPWTLYQVYGDKDVLKIQYHSMKKWIDFMRTHAVNHIWNYKLQFGDWVALDAEPGSYYGATPNDLTCTAFYAYSTGLFTKIAKVLNEEKDAKEYKQLYEDIKDCYQKRFFDNDGHLVVKTQTAQIVSLYFQLVPEKYKNNVISDLKQLLKDHNGHLVTGFVGTPYFCHALSQNGCAKEAFELLLKEDFPSWLYQVKMGATTIWEHWDGKKADGTMWSPDMNSFNHYAYGAIGDWLYRVVAGINTDEEYTGYKQSVIKPQVGGFDYVTASYESIYGTIKVSWRREKKHVKLMITIPCNTSARLQLTNVKTILEKDNLIFEKKQDEWETKLYSGDYEIIYEEKE